MLINATQQEELRMAMVDGQRLYDLNIEAPSSERKKANIYKGKITRIEPSLEAAFVDYGSDRHGFLPLKEISSEYFVKDGGSGKPNIKDVLREGQDIVVQVDKEERGNKGAALTTFVSLAGRFIVLKPNKGRSGGVSRRITGSDRDLARKSLNEIEIPDGMSVILRTAGIDRSAEELKWDLENLLTVWTAILNVVLERPSPFLIYRESDTVVRALRDYLTNEIGEILIDNETTYKDAREFVEQVMPHNLRKLKHYDDPVPLFTRFQIESQIESAFAHSVSLPSGGSIVIDHTEALVSIDVNSARATKGGDIEATALNTNIEAAEEVARQLRIRDLGGLVVIDFIDMGPQKHQRDVENKLREAVRQDRARVQIGKISRFGLLEMSRQRLRPSIGESAYQTCPRCSGFGTIRSIESLALAILRLVGEEARKERTSKVIAQLPVEVATYLLNEKRDWVRSLEASHDTQVVMVANSALETPHYEVRRVRDDQVELPENSGVSYELSNTPIESESPQAILERKAIEQPVVGTLKPSKPAPRRAPPPRKGLWATLMGFFGGDEDEAATTQGKSRGRRAQPQRQRSSSRKAASKRGQQRKKSAKKKTTKQKATKKAGSKTTATRKTTSKKTTSRKRKAKTDSQAARAPKKSASQTDENAKPTDSGTQRDTAESSGNEPKRTPRGRRSRGGRRRRGAPDNKDQVTEDRQGPDTKSGTPAEKPESAKQSQSGPSKPHTDAERARDSAKLDDTASMQELSSDKAVSTKKPQRTSGPPKPRTDAERARDSAKLDDTASMKTPSSRKASGDEPQQVPAKTSSDSPPRAPAEAKPVSDSKPSAGGNGAPGEMPPAAKLLPWEPQPAAVTKPPSKTAAPKPAPKPDPAPKPEDRPADQAPD
jgi:ribonuclease E